MIIDSINNDLTATVGTASVPFEFVYDSASGKYGYKDGADTFRPFNDGSGGYKPNPASIFVHNYTGSYTSNYTVAIAGIYVAIAQTNGTDTNSRSITTTGGTVLLTAGTSTDQSALIKVIDCKVRNTITIYGNAAGGYPYNTNILTRIATPSV